MVVNQPKLDEVVEHYFQTLFPDPELRAWWYRPSASFESDGTWRFFKIKFTEVYVIDLEEFMETKIDKRIAVDIDEVFSLLKQKA